MTAGPPLRVAIVGAGLMGRWHARYAAAEGARVAAIVDVELDRALDLGLRFPEARAVASLEESLRTTPVDVVHVCTDVDRVALVEQALEAGRHVLAEKPVARSEAEALRLLASAAGRGVQLCPVHQFAFQRGFRRVLEGRRRLGALVRVEGTLFSAGGDGRPDAERREILLGMVPHFLSLFRALVGPLSPPDWTVVFTADDLEIRSRKAEVALSLCVSLRARPRRNELRVVGTEGTAHVDLYHGFATFEAGPATRAGKALAPFRQAARVVSAATLNLCQRALSGEPAFPGLRALIHAFHGSVRGHGEPPVDSQEILESAVLIERLATQR